MDYWKGQTKRTVRTTTNEKSVGREANSLVKRYGAELDATDIQGDLQSLYDAMANGELDGKEAFSQAKEIAGKLVENAVEAVLTIIDRGVPEAANRFNGSHP